jgi:DNA-binding Xre family transcriptional regulator
MEKRISLAAVRRLAEERGIKTQLEFAEAAGINRNTARRWWVDDPTMTRIETSVLISLCDLFGVQPGDLLEYVGDEDE